MTNYRRLYRLFKPVIEKIVAVLAFLILIPISIVIATCLKFSLGGNPFFTQLRPGRNEKIFRLIKFRTMTNESDNHGDLLPDIDRLTYLGKLVRSSSLDEIPQLMNIIKGDMSFVGPRPLLVEYLPLYNDDQRRRHDVKPGITGWAQVNGRNVLSWDEKFKLDVWYVNNQCFSLDIKILWLTVIKVFKREGISSDSSVTMEKFNGSI